MMKVFTQTKWVVIVLGLLLSTLSLAALSSDGNYAIAGGVSVFNQSLSNSSAQGNSSVGAYVGSFGDVRLSSSLYLTPGIWFVQKGVQDSSSSTRASYLETTALLKTYLFDRSQSRFYLAGGGGLGVLLDASSVSSGGVSTDLGGSMMRNELSAQLGLGYETSVGEETDMILGATYSRGLTNNLDVAQSGGVEGKWSGIYAFLALRFHPTQESNTPEDRAMDYLKWKNGSKTSSSDPATQEKFVDSITP